MCVASCVSKNTRVTCSESIERFAAVGVKTEVIVAAVSFCPLLMVAHDDDRSRG